jgi:hypothetical protein
MWDEPLPPLVIQGMPTLVFSFTIQHAIKLSEGPALVEVIDHAMDFWGFLCSWGGEWMWEGVQPDKDSPQDMLWVAEGLTNGSLIWVTDGSYDRKKAIDLCGVGWIIFCTKTGYP